MEERGLKIRQIQLDIRGAMNTNTQISIYGKRRRRE